MSVSKTKIVIKREFHRFNLKVKIRALIVVVAAIGLIGGSSLVHADQFQSQIDTLQSQNDQSQSIVNSLTAQATSYQGAIDQLQAQINALQAAIAVNQTKQAELEQQIASMQQEITDKKKQLGATIKAMYIDGQTSTIEELASSKNLSSYVDKEEYRQTVQDQLNAAINQILALEAQLQQQKSQLDIVVNTEQQQNNQLNTAEQQQQQLLTYNQGQQAAFNQQISTNQQQIAALRAEQIAANHKLVGTGQVLASGSCGGSYPATAVSPSGGNWGCDYPLDNTIDNWGMYNRECVSYTAWMVYKNYGYMPYWGGNGNANEWPADARAAGIQTGSTPKVGSVAIYMGGASDPFGHAMWVTGVSGNMITVQQYNLYYDGNYYETTVNGSGLVYIYFGG